MEQFVGYIYFDSTRDWESYFSTNAHWADDEEEWYLGGTVKTLNDIYSILENQGFDFEYIENFIALNLSHYEYMQLAKEEN